MRFDVAAFAGSAALARLGAGRGVPKR